MARNRPETTFHFAPLLVAGSWGAARRSVDAAPAAVVAGLPAAAGGLAMAAVTAAELAWVGALDGPSFGLFPNAGVETAVFALLGAGLGFRFVTRPRPGLLFTG